MAANIPKKIGKYDVLDVVGKGGMGIVYRAKDPFLDRMVAIKIMTISYADYPDLLQRFYREAKATANLQHPNIVTVYELGEHEGSPYLAMQFLEGASLETLVRSGQQLTLLQKLDIIIQACHGLSYAHQRGIVHRDIKPGNIMVLKDGNVKIVDFGIARIGDTNFTRTGQFMGSLNYMSLEQLNDKLQVDQRTDVYSTGVVLYQILTGALPFEADSTGATLMKILNEAPAPFSKYHSSYPPELETITMKALAKDRDQRYSSADELALDLTQLLDHLKQERIGVHMQQAELLLQQNNLFQANDELLEVLKLDKQHTRAASMLRTLRKQIEKEQSVERSRQLREQAEEALRREDFDPALGFIEQAIHLDTTNADLQQFRLKVQAAKAEIEHLRQVMQRAENAHRAGNLDTAKQAIEEVLAHRPNDTRVKSLYRMIQKELEERLRQKRMESLLEAARKEMANRRFTAAFDILKEAEKVDPEAPALRSLLDTFTTAREQEQRKRALEQLTRQIEQALNTDDHQAALNLLTEGLQRFPTEPALLKLKDLAETQRQAAQTKSFVRERIAAAREILNAGNAAGALKVLQDALTKVPGNPHLESLVSMAQERLAQDRDDQARARCVQQANEALGRRAYDEAIRLLEAGQVQFAASSEIDNLLRFAREQQAKEAKKQEVENSVRRAQEFLRTQEYDRAIELLESILSRAPDEELSIVLEEAKRRRNDLNRQIAAAVARGQQFLREGSAAKAVEFLQTQPTSFRRSDEFRELMLQAANQNRPHEPDVAVEPKPELEAPEPAKTMMWNTLAPPEIEVEAPTAPRIPERPRPQPVPQPPSPKPPVTPGFLQRLTKQQKLLAAVAAGVVLFVVVVIAIWPTSKATVRTNVETAKENPLPPTPAPPVTGTLTVQTNVDAVDVFIDNDPKRVTSGKQLQVTLAAGTHDVRVDKKGYDQLAPQTVRIEKDDTFTLPLTLTETKGTPSFLEIKSKPGAKVSVDQKYRGTIGTDGTLRVQVTPAQHLVGVNADDSFPWLQETPVKQGEAVSIIATLTPKPVAPKPAAAIVSFTGPSNPIPQGQTAKIAWETKNAKEVDVDGIGSNLEPSGSRDIVLTQNRIFKLVAKGEGGNDSRDLTVTVAVAPPKAPVVSSFTASATKIKQGDSVTLAWSTTDAQSVTIDGVGANLPASGSQPVTPAQNTTYSLSAIGAGGTTKASATVTVEAKAPPPPPPPPSTNQGASEAVAIKDSLDKFREAYNQESTSILMKQWPSMNAQQKKGLDATFKNLRAIDIQLAGCTDPVVSGSTATEECMEQISYTAPNGDRSKLDPHRRLITLKKTGGAWLIDSYAVK